MVFRVHFDPTGGINNDSVFAVYDPDYPATMSDPYSNLQHLKLHSQLEYFHVIDRQTHSITIPAQGYPHSHSDQIVIREILASFSGYADVVALTQVNNDAAPNNHIYSIGSGSWWRKVYIGIDGSNNLVVSDNFRNSTTTPLPAVTLSVTITVMSPDEGAGQYAYENAGDGIVRVGYGAFDTTRKYIRKEAGGSIVFSLGETERQSSNGGVQYVDTDGTVQTTANYTGSGTVSVYETTAE